MDLRFIFSQINTELNADLPAGQAGFRRGSKVIYHNKQPEKISSSGCGYMMVNAIYSVYSGLATLPRKTTELVLFSRIAKTNGWSMVMYFV
jgi:hypothetical protein